MNVPNSMLPLIGLLLSCAMGCQAADESHPSQPQRPGTSKPTRYAGRIEVKPFEHARFGMPDLEVMESMPVQFAMNIADQSAARAGRAVDVISVAAPDAEGRIVVELARGDAVGVGRLRVHLGSLPVGSRRAGAGVPGTTRVPFEPSVPGVNTIRHPFFMSIETT